MINPPGPQLPLPAAEPRWLRFFRPPSVKALVIAGFGALVVVLVGVVIGSAALAREHESGVAKLEDRAYTASLLQRSQAAAADAALLTEHYLLTSDESLVPEIRSGAESALANLAEAAARETANHEEGDAADIIHIRAKALALVEASERIISLRQSGDAQTAAETVERTAPQYRETRRQLEAAASFEMEEVSSAADRADALGRISFWMLVLSGALGTVLAAGLALLLIRAIVRPLLHLESTACAIAGGVLSARAPVSGPRELASLGAALNRMTESLLDGFRWRELNEQRERALGELEETHRAVQESEARWRSLVDNTQDIITLLGSDGSVQFSNPAGERLLGYPLEEVRGSNAFDRVHPEDRPALAQKFRSLVQEPGSAQSAEFRFRHKNGSWRVMEAVGSLLAEQKANSVVIVSSRDVTARRDAEERYRTLVENIPDVTWTSDQDGGTTFISSNVKSLSGFTPEEIYRAGPNLWMGRIHRDDLEAVREGFLRLFTENKMFDVEYRIQHKDGRWIWLHDRAMKTYERAGVKYADGVLTDVTARREAEEAMRRMAYHDALTGLPNRALFQDRFAIALAQARRSGQGLAVMSLDVDRFKLVNDTLGHAGGDRLLQRAAQRLATLVREGDTLARLGGDEFFLLLPGCAAPQDASRIAEKITRAFRQPFQCEGREFHATVSAGISLYPQDGDDLNGLVQAADAAMYRAKDMGRNTYQLYAPAMNRGAAERLNLESDLHRAIEQQELEVYYQPQVSVSSGQVVGVEALVRWHAPGRGVVGPAEFIAVAEETGLIVPLGEWVLRTACGQAQAWLQAGLPPLRLAVNISMRQFHQPDLVATIARALTDTGLAPTLLELEITESTAMRDAEYTIAVLRELVAMGIRISIDDFGSGHSSLRYLRDFPISTLKIDQSFVRDVTVDSNDASIAIIIISLGHSLNLEVVGEGVETEEQLAFLRGSGCDLYQGYLCAKPMPAAELEAFLRSGDNPCGVHMRQARESAARAEEAEAGP